MIELATRLSILKEAAIMTMNFSTADQIVSPAQVWTHLSTDLQVHVVRLLAQLAAHLVLAEGQPANLARKETGDALSSLTQQDPA
jgi:proline dehydrogenase